MVASHELLHAYRTGEVLLAGVGARVTGQFIAAREPFATVGPLAWEGPFAGVRSQMRLQMRTLPIYLVAVAVRALVCLAWNGFDGVSSGNDHLGGRYRLHHRIDAEHRTINAHTAAIAVAAIAT